MGPLNPKVRAVSAWLIVVPGMVVDLVSAGFLFFIFFSFVFTDLFLFVYSFLLAF